MGISRLTFTRSTAQEPSIYGDYESGISEEADEDVVDGTCSGTGMYLVSIRLNNPIPNMIPKFGQKITITLENQKEERL